MARITDPANIPGDALRILVDRLWPRGIRKDAPPWDVWMPDIAPSHPLRTSYHGGMLGFSAFGAAYRAELARNPKLPDLRAILIDRPIRLLTYAKNVDASHLPILANYLTRAEHGL